MWKPSAFGCSFHSYLGESVSDSSLYNSVLRKLKWPKRPNE